MTYTLDPHNGRFDEHALREDIVSIWGEHGAHVDLYDYILTLANVRKEERDNLANALRSLGYSEHTILNVQLGTNQVKEISR